MNTAARQKSYAAAIKSLATTRSMETLTSHRARFAAPVIVEPLKLFPELKAAHDAQFVGVLKIGRRQTVRVLSIEDASFAYQVARDESGEGGSTFPDGQLTIGANVYRVSYNGKVWANLEWKSGDVPVFNPYAQ